MSALKRILGFILVATAIVVGVIWVITPIHHDGSPAYPVWKVVNWFMAFSVLAALIANIARKRAVGSKGADSPITREYLEANVAFYPSLLLAPWIFTNFLTYDFFMRTYPLPGSPQKMSGGSSLMVCSCWSSDRPVAICGEAPRTPKVSGEQCFRRSA